MWYEPILARGLVPDPVIRLGIRAQLRHRLREEAGRRTERQRFFEELARGPIAHSTDSANEQHYEVPVDFFETVLADNNKYSCALWNEDTRDLASAEREMLDLYVERAQIETGHRILDLGCGWGSFSLYLAARFPECRILAVSNSEPQIEHIRARAAARGLANLQAVRANINDFAPDDCFDRVVSIEMFEHMRNFRELLRRIASWLDTDGKLFVHHFAHREYIYPFDAGDNGEWMARHFFTGGIMPSARLLEEFSDHLVVRQSWEVNGRHYQRTCEAWLEQLDANRAAALRSLAGIPDRDPRELVVAWRIFFMACAELFGYRDGEEWFVVHHLLEPARP